MNHSLSISNIGKKYMCVWDMLVKFVDEGLAHKGTVGELVGHVLSILAMDKAIDDLPQHRELKYQTPITVAAYYQALLTNEAWDELHRSLPANGAELSKASAAMTFQDAFANAYLHFSHYARAHDSAPIKDTLLWALWLCGTAILGEHNQKLIDCVLPIFFAEPASPPTAVSPMTVGVIYKQDKAGESACPDTVAIQHAESLNLYSQGQKSPYIAAVHCYALTTTEGIRMRMDSGYDLQHPENDEEVPHYQIDFWGMAAYRAATELVKANVQRMINSSKNALFINHPRDYGILLLREALPVLSGDLDTTKWCVL
jgi:hypothetical protein